MTQETWTERIEQADPLVIDAIIAFGLTVLVFVQLAVLGTLRPDLPGPAFIRGLHSPQQPGFAAYVVAAGAFIPLIIRRRIPWLALLLTSAFALICSRILSSISSCSGLTSGRPRKRRSSSGVRSTSTVIFTVGSSRECHGRDLE